MLLNTAQGLGLGLLPWCDAEYKTRCYSSPNITRVIKLRERCVGHVARMGDRRSAYRILVGISEGKKQAGKPKRRWDFQEEGCGSLDLFDLV
jgi:hypothetical protein